MKARPAPSRADYARAAAVAGLSPERQARLVEHVLSRNVALANERPVPLAVARSAAALLAADPDRLSGPTALAQAEALAQAGQVGPALMQIQESLQVLATNGGQALGASSAHTPALRRILQHLVAEATGLLRSVEP